MGGLIGSAAVFYTCFFLLSLDVDALPKSSSYFVDQTIRRAFF